MKELIFYWDTCPEEKVALTMTDEEAKVIDAFLTFAEFQSLFDSNLVIDKPDERPKPCRLSDYYPK